MEPVSEAELATWAGEARERWKIPALAVGLLREGEVSTAGSGASSEDVFRIASITKPFTATLASELLDLDAPPAGTRVSATVRQLLSHQGGLACEWPTPLEEFGGDDDALLRLAAQEPRLLPYSPGELFSYSNVGFWLVGAAAARAHGATFEETMQELVFDRFELGSTGFEPTSLVPGYVQVAPGADEHRQAAPGYPRVRRPSGGICSSVDDLLRFAERQFDLGDLQTPTSAGPGFEHGLGWFLLERGGRRSVEHPGSAAGYQSLLMLVPAERVAFVGLTNSTRGSAAIKDVLERLGLARTRPDEVALEPEVLAAFAGRYEAPGVRMELEQDGRRLWLRYSEKDPFRRQWESYPPMLLRAVGERDFEIVDGEWRGEMLGFPREDVLSFGIAAQRVA